MFTDIKFQDEKLADYTSLKLILIEKAPKVC